MNNNTLTAEQLDALIGSGSGDAALLFLHILRSGGYSVSAVCRDTGMSRERCLEAASVLRSAGIAVEDKPPESSEMPEYSPAEIVLRAQKDSSFEGLVDQTQRLLGRLLSAADMKILLGIYDHLGMPADVIYLLINHCIDDTRSRLGEGRMPTMRQIEKEAWFWAQREILSYEQAEEHIRREAERKTLLFRSAEALQIRGREPSPGERKYIESWLDMGFGPEALALAYDRTVLGTGKLAWRYMDKILSSWHGKGLHGVEEILSGDGRGPKKPETAAPAGEGDSELDQQRRLLAYLKNKEG